MSPEQARGEAIDGRTDLFSLGLVLYEMATGHQAFAGATTAVVFDGILNRAATPPGQFNAGLPQDLERVILRALEKDRRLRYQTAADLVADLTRIKRDSGTRTVAVSSGTVAAATYAAPGGDPRTQPTAVASAFNGGASTAATTVATAAPAAAKRRTSPLLIFGAPAVLLLGIAGFWFWNSTRTPAFADRDLVLVADFVNSTGDQVFDDALKQAVSVQLQQTSYVTLVSDQQTQRTLKLMQRPADAAVTGAVAREVCQRLGAKATVEGSIAPIGSSYVIALGVHNCQTGDSISEQQVQASSKEDVLKAIGGAVTDLRKHLGESLASIQKNDMPAEATTSSLEALRAYGQATKARYSKGDQASVPFYLQAIDHDPNFALAYAKLAVVSGNLGKPDDAKKYTMKAYELRDKVSEYERLYITWGYAKINGDAKLEHDTLEIMTTSYPKDYVAHNNFGVYLMSHGTLEEALAQYQAALDASPNEPNPLGNAAGVLLNLGRLDEASALIDRLLQIRPDPNIALNRWLIAVVLNDPRAAQYETVARKVASDDGVLNVQAQIALWHGQLNDYVSRCDRFVTKMRAAHDDAEAESIALQRNITLAALQGGRAMDNLRASITPATPLAVLSQELMVLAILGDVDTARREVPRLDRADTNNDFSSQRAVIHAYMKARDHHPKEAIADLQAVLAETPRAVDINLMIGRFREDDGDRDGAIESYRALIKSAGILGTSMQIPATRLALVRALSAKGDTVGAKEQLDVLQKQFANADPDFILAKNTRDELAKIK